MNIFLDGVSILYEYKVGIFVYFFAALGIGSFSIKHTLDAEIDASIRLLASFSIGSIVLSAFSYMLILLSHFLPFMLRPGSFVILIFAVYTLLWGGGLSGIKMGSHVYMIMGAIFLLLIIRLSLLKYSVLPPYSDSPVHYQIVLGFLHPDVSNNSKISLETILSNYYHFGFHSLAAWLTAVVNLEPAKTISLLGQFFLVLVPVSVLFLTYALTKDGAGALIAGLLAAIGWVMPAFAVNWGKFPALGSLATMPAVLAFLWLHWHGCTKKNTSLFFGIVILIGITLMHTRIIVCVLLFAISFFLSDKLSPRHELGNFQSIRYSLLYIISLWPFWKSLTDFYMGIPIAIAMLILLPFAFQAFPRLAIGLFLFTFGLWLIASIPTLINNNYVVLLDRQFLEIMLYFPFAVMGGIGSAGLINRLPSTGMLRGLALSILAGCILLNSLIYNSMYPDSCCDYFKESDRLAFEWIQERSSENTLVLISVFDDNGQIVGTDAGVWLFPLIGQPVNKLPFNSNWNSLLETENICPSGAGEIYIYMGGRGYSFDNAQLAQLEWIKLVFRSGPTLIYQISECPK